VELDIIRLYTGVEEDYDILEIEDPLIIRSKVSYITPLATLIR
jgi:hypothetical protein